MRMGLPQSRLESIAKALAAEGEQLPDCSFLNDPRRTVTPYGPLIDKISLPTKEGPPMEIEFANPMALIHKTCTDNPAFATLLTKSVTSAGPSPILMYTDACSAGDPLKTGARSKNVNCVSKRALPSRAT